MLQMRFSTHYSIKWKWKFFIHISFKTNFTQYYSSHPTSIPQTYLPDRHLMGRDDKFVCPELADSLAVSLWRDCFARNYNLPYSRHVINTKVDFSDKKGRKLLINSQK